MAEKAIVLLSGGMDSATVLAVAKEGGCSVVALTFDYGQRHRKEIRAARRIARHFGIEEHRILKLDFSGIGASALTDSRIGVPERRSYEEIGTGIPPTYVPARNTVFLSHALASAEATGAEAIYIAANAIDYSVGGETKVWLRRLDRVRLVRIAEAIRLSGDDWQTVAVNPETLQLEWRLVTGRFRHDSGKKRCFEIRLERGQEITITEDHSLFTIDPMSAQIRTVTGSQIREGTPIVVPSDLSDVTDAWDNDMDALSLNGTARFCRESSRPWSIREENGHVTNRLRRTRFPVRFPVTDELLAMSEIAFLRVSDIRETRSPWMYDLSVKGAENFVANGILAHNSGYPDCRPEYFEAFQEVARLGTRRGVEGEIIEIRTPLIHMTKQEIVQRGTELGVPFELTWSCYYGREKACGVCDACQLRLKGFQEAELDDPLPYETRV